MRLYVGGGTIYAKRWDRLAVAILVGLIAEVGRVFLRSWRRSHRKDRLLLLFTSEVRDLSAVSAERESRGVKVPLVLHEESHERLLDALRLC